MSYRKIISTFPTNLSKYKKNIFAVREDINEIFANNNISIQNISNITGSNNIFHITSSLTVLGEINSNDNYKLRNNLKISDSQEITKKINNIQINSGDISFNSLKVKDSFIGKEITGSLEYIDKERTTKYIVQGEGISVNYNTSTKQFECSRENSSLDTGDSTSLIFTCDPNSSNTNEIFTSHYVTHDINDSGVTNDNKYNIRSNLGTDPKYCTNTVILQPGFNSIDEDDPLIRAITSSTKQIFEFKNLDVMPGWTTGSNDVIGNGDIYWPVTIDDDVKKASQTIILDFSKLLEENVLLPGKSIQIKWDDSYNIETTYPILMKKDSGQYHFPSGSTSFGDDGAANSYQGNNEHSFYLGKCTFNKDDLEGTSSGEDDLSSVSSMTNPISKAGSLKELSPFYYLEGLNLNNYNHYFKNYNYTNTKRGKFSTSSVAKRHIQKSNISISTFKPRLMLGLGENSIVYKDESDEFINNRLLEVSSSFKVTTSPPVLAKFESANNYRFFNSYDENISGGEKVHPIILHKIFPDVLPEYDGSYFKNTKISFSEISEFLSLRTDSNFSGNNSNLTPTNLFNQSQFKYSGFATYTILSSSFYYDLKNDLVLNKFCKNLNSSETWSIPRIPSDQAQAIVLSAATRNLKLHIPFVGLKDKSSNRDHDLGNVIKNKYHNLFYDFQIPTNYSENFSLGTTTPWNKFYNLEASSNTIPNKITSNLKSETARILLTYSGINSNIPSNINSRNFGEYTASNYRQNGTILNPDKVIPEIDTPVNFGNRGPHSLGIWTDGFTKENTLINHAKRGGPGIYGYNGTDNLFYSIEISKFSTPSVFSDINDLNESTIGGTNSNKFPLFVNPTGKIGKEPYKVSASTVNDYLTQDNHYITYNDDFYDAIPKLLPQVSGKNSIELMYIGLDSSNNHQWIIIGVG